MKVLIEIGMPTHEDLPPTREEKWQSFREKVEELMENVEIGHDKEYSEKCLCRMLHALRNLRKPTVESQSLTKKIEKTLMEYADKAPLEVLGLLPKE